MSIMVPGYFSNILEGIFTFLGNICIPKNIITSCKCQKKFSGVTFRLLGIHTSRAFHMKNCFLHC